MSRIFLVMTLLSNAALLFTLYLGWSIADAASLSEAARRQVSMHFLFALASSGFALMTHAVVLTYFMGTGRWIEETSAAYRFQPDARKENIRLKYGVIPGMMFCMLLLMATGALGAIADPASNMRLEHAATIHFTLAVLLVASNGLVSLLEYRRIGRNTQIVDAVYAEVLRVRKERGLDVPSPPALSPATESPKQTDG